MRRCSTCDASDFKLEVHVVWEEERVKGGETKTENKDERWLRTMISPEVGIQLERSLFPKDEQAEATGKGPVEGTVPRIWTVGPEAESRLVEPYRGVIDGLTGDQLIEIEPEPGDTLRTLETRVRRAARQAGRKVELGETQAGTLLVWLAEPS